MRRSLNRRMLLGSAGALIMAGASRVALAGGAAEAPKATVRPVIETLHGVSVTDNYRWMENAADPEWKPYLAGQNAYARRVLGAISGRDALAAKISALTGAQTSFQRLQVAGAYVFTQMRPAQANTSKLFVREGVTGADRLLFDPDNLAVDGRHYALSFWMASPDGRYVAYGASPAGSEDAVLYVVETATGRQLPNIIDRTQFGMVSWLPDSSGFFINRLREGAKHGDQDRYLNSVCWMHRLGVEGSADIKLMASGLDAAVPLTEIQIPEIFAQTGVDYVFGAAGNGTQNDYDVYIAPLASARAGHPIWSRVASQSDMVTDFAILGASLYLKSHKNAPHFEILKTSLAAPDLAKAEVVLRESSAVIVALEAAKDGVYVATAERGFGRVLRIGPDDAVTPMTLPFEGAVEWLTTDPLQDGCWFNLAGWVRPEVVCLGKPDGTVQMTAIAPEPSIDLNAYESQEVMIRARDGVQVPLSIIRRKDRARDGTAPLYLLAYGAFGLSFNPFFDPKIIAWLDLGGVWAVAHVRGGGELGEDWHRAGEKLTKPNSWRDAIDCAQYLIDNRWTSKGRVAIAGGSAGAIVASRFLTERPDLLSAAILRVGVCNALRFEFSENGPDNVPELGTVKDLDGFRALYEMDGYQHVRDGVAYPGVLLTTGLHDPRVANWQPAKMTARLQAATVSGKPVLLRVEADAGHGIGSTRRQIDEEYADTFAFILWQTGDRRFRAV